MSCKIKIEKILIKTFAPLKLVVIDESAQHAGHAQALASGGGHFMVEIISQKFEGLSQVERHRLINKALSPLLKSEIHALSLKIKAPSEAD